MARLARFALPGYTQHVISRGHHRARVFRDNDDHRYFLEKLGAACAANACDLHAYVLMPNHVHLLVTPQEERGLSKTMQAIGRSYVRYFNDKYGLKGTLWEGRYRATLIDSERYFLVCSRYIELNPVRARGLVDDPVDYCWSSYRGNTGQAVDQLLTPHPVYRRLGSQPAERHSAYRDLFEKGFDVEDLTEIRNATNKAWPLGGDRFKAEIERKSGRRSLPLKRGGDRRSAAFQKSKRFGAN